MTHTRVSVAMATCEGQAFLEEQLASVAQQIRPPDELVVCDDRSTDGTVEIVRRFAERASFPVRLLENSERIGSRRNFDRAIAACSGDLIALCDQDDVWASARLGHLESVLLGRPNAMLAFSDGDVVDADLSPLGYTLWEHFGVDELRCERARRGHALTDLLTYNFVTGATVMCRAELRRWCMPIPHDLHDLEHDGWMALVAATIGEIIPVPEALISYRQHPRQQLGADRRRPIEARPRRAPLRCPQFDNDIRLLSMLLERVSEAPTTAGATGPTILADRLAHYQLRARLPTSTTRRTRAVARELVTRRYGRYSQGLRSALKDVVLQGGIRSGHSPSSSDLTEEADRTV